MSRLGEHGGVLRRSFFPPMWRDLQAGGRGPKSERALVNACFWCLECDTDPTVFYSIQKTCPNMP